MRIQETFPLIWSNQPGEIADWAVDTLGLTETWRAANDEGHIEHVELAWGTGKISINIRGQQYVNMGPCGISLRLDDEAAVKEIYERAQKVGAEISQPLAESRVAYSFTALDADGNQWWVNAETGFLDQLRRGDG